MVLNEWFFKGGSTQNRWVLMGDFSKGGVHKTDGVWWVIFPRGEYTKPMDFWWVIFQRGEYIKPICPKLFIKTFFADFGHNGPSGEENCKHRLGIFFEKISSFVNVHNGGFLSCLVRHSGLSQCLWKNEPGHADSDVAGLQGGDGGGRHCVAEVRQERRPARHQPRGGIFRRCTR